MTDLESQYYTGAEMGVTHSELRTMAKASPEPVTLTCSVVGRKVRQSIKIARRRDYLSVSAFTPGAEHRNVSVKSENPFDWGIFQSYNNLIKQ